MSDQIAAATPDATEIVRKQIDVADIKGFALYKAGDEQFPYGGFTGYANPFGELDSAGDITLPGFFAPVIKDFLRDGFVPTDHAWGIRSTVAYPIIAKEDDYGLLITSKFHSTQDAQDARAIANERLADGLTVKLSIGFTIDEFEYVKGVDAVQYLRNPTPDQIAACSAMSRVRLLITAKKLYEVSLVSVPAAHGSDVLSVKSADAAAAESKGIHLGDDIEENAAFSVLAGLTDRLMWKTMYAVLFDAGETTIDAQLAILDEAMDELKETSVRIIGALLRAKDPVALADAKADLVALLETKTDAPPAERTVANHSALVLAATTELHTRLADIHDLRTKAGRKISRATRALLEPHPAALRAAADTLDSLLADEDGDGEPDVTVVGGKSTAEAITTTIVDPNEIDEPTTVETSTDDDAEIPAEMTDTFIDPEIANGIYAAFTIAYGIPTHE